MFGGGGLFKDLQYDCAVDIQILEIPGFYYDEDAKKYFRITKDHPGPKKKLKKADINRVK